MSSALERMLGFAEGAVSAIERMLVPAQPAARTPSGRQASQGRYAGPTKHEQQRALRSFRVIEVIEETGELSWVVSDGYDRAVCNTATFAERVRMSLG